MSEQKKTAAILAIALLGFLIYANTLTIPFLYDDFHTLVENPFIKQTRYIPSLFDLSFIRASPNRSTYRPVLMLTFTLNYLIGRLDVIGYHLINISLHIANAILIFLLLNLLPGSTRGQGVPLFTSLIFLVHPVNAEAVNYISCRSELLSSFFILLTFFLCLKSLNEDNSSFWRASLITFILGLLSKETAALVPLALVLYDVCFLREKKGFFRRFTRHYLVYFLIFIVYLALRDILLGHFLGNLYETAVSRGYFENLFTQAKVAVFVYLKILFFPISLAIDHTIPVSSSFFEPEVLFSSSCILGLVLTAFLVRRTYPWVTFFIFWFFLNLLPTAIIPLHIIANEHRLYLASISFAFMFSYGIMRMLRPQEITR